MIGLTETALALRGLVQAAAKVARNAAIVAPLAHSSGLTHEGVKLALSRCLELDATDAELESLATRAVPSTRVHVILSANVFTAPLRALLVARATSLAVSVRPSRRDPIFARALVLAAHDTSITLAEDLAVADVTEGEIHVYGRDGTVASVRLASRPGVLVRAHGAGLGIAVVGKGARPGLAARSIAEDVVLFDQRGCLSPRIVLVEGDDGAAAALAHALDAELDSWGRAIPRGRLDERERVEAARYAETMAFVGRILRGASHLVGLAAHGGPLMMPPPGRHVHVVAVRDLAEGARVLEPIAPLIVAIGCDDEERWQAVVPVRSRRASLRVSRLGSMQIPRLDGPVDLR